MKKNNNNGWGGFRENSGKPRGDRDYALSVRISKEAKDKISLIHNKSEFIDNLIKTNL
jgi:hypothetical protein